MVPAWLVGRRVEVGGHAVDFLARQGFRTVLEVGKFCFDHAREFLGADGFHQDLDARLVLVVAAAELVVHAHDRFRVGQQVLPGHEIVDDAAQDRGAAHAAADHELEADFAARCMHGGQADVVHGDRGAVLDGAVDGDLELARQGDEFGVEGAPLAQDLGERARIDDLVRGHAGEFVGRDVADAIARGLDRVHLDRGQVGQDVRGLLQLDPVELDVLARGEVAVAAVVACARCGRTCASARSTAGRRARRCAACRRGAACTGRSAGAAAGILLRSAHREAALHLVAVLRDALADDEVVVLVVAIHGRILWGRASPDPNYRNINKMELYSKLLRIYLLI
jgi:hypothetical protein